MAGRNGKIPTTCTRDCPSCCGLLAEVGDGRVVALRNNPDHPVTGGAACPKLPKYVKRVMSPERVLSPLRRRGGEWVGVTWDEALDELAGRIGEAVSRDGPEAVLNYQGFGERTALKIACARFFAHLGGVTGLAGTLCGGTGYAAMSEDFGPRVSHDPLDHLSSRTIVLWGRNPAVTQPGILPILRQAKKRGARIILIDPRRTESAALADRHIAPRPGSDAFLALAAARLVIEAGQADAGFIEKRSEGFAAFRDIVLGRSMADLLAACDVSPEEVAVLAEALRDKPAAILLGWGLHRWEYAHEAVRAIDALSAISGNIGLSGGGVSQGFEEWGPYAEEAWGYGLHPPRRTLLMPRIGEELARADAPRIKVAVITAANPVCMAPDSEAVGRAFDGVDFVVQMNLFLDDTSDHADLFLPCATFLEERDIVASYGHNYVGPVNRTMAPRGECRSLFDIFMDLGGRFPFAGEYVKSEDEWLRRIVAPLLSAGVDWDALWRGPTRIPGAPLVPWADGVFATPSGKFRFLDRFGTPLPGAADGGAAASAAAEVGAVEPCGGGAKAGTVAPGGDGGGAKAGTVASGDGGDGARAGEGVSSRDYPYHFLTVGSREHLCSELTLAEHAPLPVVAMNAAEAARLGIADGDEAVLSSPLGELRGVVRHDPAARPDTLSAPRGGWLKAGHGVNRIVPAVMSRLGQGTAYYEARVNIRPA